MKIKRFEIIDFDTESVKKKLTEMHYTTSSPSFFKVSENAQIYAKHYVLEDSIEITIMFDVNNLHDWNDEDEKCIEVLDEDFLQYYQPFYDCQAEQQNYSRWDFMQKVAAKYNNIMLKLVDAGILVEV